MKPTLGTPRRRSVFLSAWSLLEVLVLGLLLPWRATSGVACHDAALLLLLAWLALSLQAWAFVTHLAVAEGATLGAGFGLFIFLVLLAELIAGRGKRNSDCGLLGSPVGGGCCRC